LPSKENRHYSEQLMKRKPSLIRNDNEKNSTVDKKTGRSILNNKFELQTLPSGAVMARRQVAAIINDLER
jgi:hypothetical protein